MISLIHLLNEVQSSPKAIFMAGPAGAGKTTILNKLNIKGFTLINVDEDYEKLLNQNLNKSDFASMSPDELSIAAQLMGKARVTTQEKELKAIDNTQNIIIDGTGSSSKQLLKKKKELESRGYKTFMVLIYVSPMTSLKRNSERDRKLPTIAVLKSWAGLVSNIKTYTQEFNSNIVIIDNDPKDADKSFNPELIHQLYPMPKGKPKSPQELEKSKLDKEKIYNLITSLLKSKPNSQDFTTLQHKINNFINE